MSEESIKQGAAEKEPATSENKVEQPESISSSNKKMEKIWTFSEVSFSLLSSTLAALLIYNYFGFSHLQERFKFSLIVRWSIVVVVWGWLMIFTLYGVDWLTSRWKKTPLLAFQICSSLGFAGVLIYLLTLFFRK